MTAILGEVGSLAVVGALIILYALWAVWFTRAFEPESGNAR